MNRQTLLATVLGGIAVLGVVAGGAFGVAATAASDSSADSVVPTDVRDGGQNTTTTQQQTQRIPITEAMAAAQNQTADQNGTVVGAELGQSGGLLDFGEDENVYTVDVLLPNGTHIEVGVNATNGSVVKIDEQEEGFLEGVFGEDDVPDEPLNLSAMHNATEAVELAQNESNANGTVTAVGLGQRNDTLVYEVRFEGGQDGEEVTVVVPAIKDGQGNVTTETGS